MAMDGPEREIIGRFAAGDTVLRDEAIRIHRINIQLFGLCCGDAHFDFMSEVDNPCPDLLLRAKYRRKVRDIHSSRETVTPETKR